MNKKKFYIFRLHFPHDMQKSLYIITTQGEQLF